MPVTNSLSDDKAQALQAAADNLRGSFFTVEDMTKAFVRTAIVRGLYAPGHRLQQDALAEVLGVSRMPVRAALRQLEAEGLVTFHPHRGATVRELTAAEIAEIYELRIQLEGFILEVAIPKLTDQILDELSTLQDPEHDDFLLQAEHRRQFYERLCDVADRPQTKQIIMRLHASVGPYRLFHRVESEEAQHLGLLDYLRKRDVEGAKAWHRKHLTMRSTELQRVILDADPPPPR
jgi:DNA-binding GntR family transcriptional regulator